MKRPSPETFPTPRRLSLEGMWALYKLAFVEEQNGDTLRQELDLLYPGVTIPMIDAASYLVIGYYYNQLNEFRKFVESVKSHAT